MLSLDSSIMSRTTTLAIDFFRMSSYHTVCMHWYTQLILLYLCCDDGFTRVVFLNFCFGVFDAHASHFFLFLNVLLNLTHTHAHVQAAPHQKSSVASHISQNFLHFLISLNILFFFFPFFCASGDAQQECRPVFYARNAAGCGASGARVT